VDASPNEEDQGDLTTEERLLAEPIEPAESVDPIDPNELEVNAPEGS